MAPTHFDLHARDNDAPIGVRAYDGVDSYVEGKRTFFAKFSDTTGIDTLAEMSPLPHIPLAELPKCLQLLRLLVPVKHMMVVGTEAQTVALMQGTQFLKWNVKDTAPRQTPPQLGLTPSMYLM